MKKKILYTIIISGFMCLFFNCVKAIGIYTVIEDDEKKDIREIGQPIVAEGMMKWMFRAVHDVIPYHVPLDEIAERIEYVYAYSNIWVDSTEKKYGELGYLPVDKKVSLTLYLAEGNIILFLPEETNNKMVWLNHELCSLYYSEDLESYLFFQLVDGYSEELGTPVNTLNDHYSWITTIEVKEGIWHKDGSGHLGFDSLVKLGEVEVTFDPKMEIGMPPIELDGNEYIDAAIATAQEILAERGIYGEFQLYVGEYGRTPAYYYNETECQMSGCIIGENVEQYFNFMISDANQINSVWLIGGQPPKSSETYFLYNTSAYVDDICQRIQKMGNGPVSFQVVEGIDYTEQDIREGEADQTYNFEVNFSGMDAEEAGKYLNYVLSYSEWFGLNELGYQAGDFRGLAGKEVIMYSENISDDIYFIPKEEVNTIMQGEDGEEYPLHVNENGVAEFYSLSENPYAVLNGQLKVCMVSADLDDQINSKYIEGSFTKIGETTIIMTDLTTLGVPKVEEDEYVLALEDHVKDLLEQSGKHGEYRISIGEYEAGARWNRVCLSAAVSGEGEEYYVRYLIVKSQAGKYYFWPTGFGLNGSLEECASDRHYMNRLCIERTKQLERSEFVVMIP